MSKPVYIKIGEAAKYLGMSTQTLRRYHEEGVLLPDHTGAKGIRYYKVSDLDDFITKGRKCVKKVQEAEPVNIFRNVLKIAPNSEDADIPESRVFSLPGYNDISTGVDTFFMQNLDVIRKPAVYVRVDFTDNIDNDQNRLNEQLETILDFASQQSNECFADIFKFGDIGSGVRYDNNGFTELVKVIKNQAISTLYVLSEEKLSRFGFEPIKMLFDAYGTNIVVMYPHMINEEEAQKDVDAAIAEINRMAAEK